MNPAGDALATAQRLIDEGKWAAAKTALERLLTKNPTHFEALTLMSYALLQMDQAGPAIYYGQRALRCDPQNLAVRLNLAACMDHAGDFAGTVRLLLQDRERVLASPRGVVSLSHSAIRSHQMLLAEQVLRQGLERFPDDHSVQGNLTQLLCESARPDEAIALYHKAIALAPERMDLVYGLAVTLNYAPSASARQIADAHLAWGRRIAAAAPPPESSWSVTPDPNRPLRIGVFSSDLRTHAMAHFLLSWFEHFNPERVQLVAYSNAPKTDAVTARFRDRASVFREITRSTDQQFFDLVRKDRIDILIDTGGLTAGERMAVFARRPAPIQATWLGFPNTSGIPAIDYRITDSIGEPEGVDPTLFAERLVRLDPLLLCYTPLGEPPALAPNSFDQPGTPQSGVIFANFGSVARYNLPTMERWCRVLRAVPGSRLLLKGYQFRDESFRAYLTERLIKAGAEPSSLILEPPAQGSAELLKHYARVDITLDAFPYTGTTTTCESLLMGVPVVTMSGSTSPSRVAPSIVTAAGFPKWIARSDDEFVQIATNLAADRARLRALRSPGPDGLRALFLRSPVGDAPAFAQRMESLLRVLWRQWCASRGPK